MTPRAITIRLAEPRDAQAIALMSRDFIEAGLGWKYDAPRVLRAIRDRDTLAVVACEGGKSAAARGAVTGFAILELGEERAHLVLLAVRPTHRRLGIGQRLFEWLLESARCAGMADAPDHTAPDGGSFEFTPKIYGYLDKEENPDILDYNVRRPAQLRIGFAIVP